MLPVLQVIVVVVLREFAEDKKGRGCVGVVDGRQKTVGKEIWGEKWEKGVKRVGYFSSKPREFGEGGQRRERWKGGGGEEGGRGGGRGNVLACDAMKWRDGRREVVFLCMPGTLK